MVRPTQSLPVDLSQQKQSQITFRFLLYRPSLLQTCRSLRGHFRYLHILADSQLGSRGEQQALQLPTKTFRPTLFETATLLLQSLLKRLLNLFREIDIQLCAPIPPMGSRRRGLFPGSASLHLVGSLPSGDPSVAARCGFISVSRNSVRGESKRSAVSSHSTARSGRGIRLRIILH